MISIQLSKRKDIGKVIHVRGWGFFDGNYHFFKVSKISGQFFFVVIPLGLDIIDKGTVIIYREVLAG